MIAELCGGEASEPRIAGEFPAGGYPHVLKTVPYRCEMALTLGGVDIARQEQRNILGRLGFIAEDPIEAEVWNIIVPTWRPDVDGWPDLVEEVVRIHGLDNVASVPLPRADGVARPTATPAQKLERRLRRAAAARGNHEAVTWSFLPEDQAAAFADGEVWTLANPISEDMKAMRPSLLPGLLSAAKRNLDRGAAGLGCSRSGGAICAG